MKDKYRSSDLIIKSQSIKMIEKKLGQLETSEGSCDYYSLYKEDATIKKVPRPCSFMQLIRFSNFLDKILMTVGCFFALGNGISLIFYAQPLKDLIMAFDPHSNPDEILSNLTTAIKAFFINSIFVFLNASLMTIAWTLSSQRQLIRIRNLYFKSLLAQEFAWYDRNKPEQVCSQMYLQTQRAQNSLVESVTGILTSFSMGLGGLIFAFARGWKMAIVMAGFLPVMLLTNYISARLSQKWESQLIQKTTNVNSNVIEIFENIKTVKYLGGEDYQINLFSQSLYTQSKNQKIFRRKTTITNAVGFFCIIFNYALGFWYGAKLVADKTFNSSSGKTYDVGDIVSIFFCIYISNLNISGISGHFNSFYNSRVALSHIIDIIDRKPRQSEGSELCISGITEIVFKNICFQFSRPLFNHLNLTIKKGVVAIVGSSGNGKSTLLNLLMKFYEPFKGQITLKSNHKTQNLKNVQAKSLRNRIGYVGQEPVLLGKTIREVLGTNYKNEQNIWKAISLSCAEQFVKAIGLDAEFKSLSGGQKQRIAIARAILRQPEVLILDEGTSALDGINERKLLKNLKEKSNIQFIIMIAHRTETLSEAQTIIKVDKGVAEIVQIKQKAFVLSNLQQQQLAQQNAEKQQQMQIQREKQKKEQIQVQQQKARCKFKYFCSLLKLNRTMYKQYIFGILSAMLLGIIFPSFSYIITRLCAIVTDIQYATSDIQIENLRTQASSISLFLIIISFASIFWTIIKGNCFLYIGENIGLKTKIYAFTNIIKREMIDIQKQGKANLIQAINSNCDSVKILLSGLIQNIAEHIITLVVGITISFIYCWQITLFSLFLIPLSLIGGKLQQRFLSGLAQNSDKVHRKTHDIVMQSIIYNRTVKSLNLQDYFFQKYRVEQHKGFKKSIRDSVFSGITLGISQCLISAMLSLIYYVGAILVDNYGVNIVNLFTAIYAIMFSGVQAGCNIGFIGQIASTTYGTARYFKLFNLQGKDLQLQMNSQKRHSKNQLVQQLQDQSIIGSSDQIKGSVQFKSVCFKYPNRSQYLFQDLSFKINENERVAIVGQSGTGKTTIADLLFKIYRADQGEILIDDASSIFYSKTNLSQQLAIVSQEPALFNRSVIQNIRYNTSASLKEIQEAAKIASAFDFVEKGGFGVEDESDEKLNKDEGTNWERIVGSRGSLLSGGQKQRIAIARAIVRRPRILVFDEATSALDKQTQEILLKNINNSLKMTQIIIAHRLSTIRSCDRIIVLKMGKVVEVGTYESLIEAGGQFANLVNALQNSQKS